MIKILILALFFLPFLVVGQVNSELNEKLNELEENTIVLSEIRNGYFQTIDSLFHAIDKTLVGKERYKEVKKNLKIFSKQQKKYDDKLDEEMEIYRNEKSVENLKNYTVTLKSSMESIVKMIEFLVETTGLTNTSIVQ